ncbi:MAG: hypothetical protein A2W04_08380 [Betaproteobacteria bacterium RBG_16_64_9]|nr:MAG: hypothetical protein A2W04_08380 [Betaproteobacteria bacterium RBG_16_64_9]
MRDRDTGSSAGAGADKPIRVILAINIGSPSDIGLRAAGQELHGSLGQPLVIENRPGGNNMIAAQACARAAADGYTFCVVSSAPMTLLPHVSSKLPFDPEKDFAPVTLLWYLIQGLVASPSLPANSVRELQALAAAKSGSLNFGTMGEGTGGDILRQTLNDYWKANMVGIAYKGANLVAGALMSGEIQLSRISLNGLSGPVKAGKLKILAVYSSKRLGLFPDTPTYTEAGLASFPDLKVWWGLFAPAGTPEAMVRRGNREFVGLFRAPKFAAHLESQLLEPAVTSSEEFAVLMKKDRELAGRIVKKYNIPRL